MPGKIPDAEPGKSGVGEVEEEEEPEPVGGRKEEEPQEAYPINAGPPRTPVQDASAELTANLDLSGSSQSDQSAEQSLDLSNPQAEAEAEAEEEEEPTRNVQKLQLSPISEDSDASSTTSSSGDSSSRYEDVSEGEVTQQAKEQPEEKEQVEKEEEHQHEEEVEKAPPSPDEEDKREERRTEEDLQQEEAQQEEEARQEKEARQEEEGQEEEDHQQQKPQQIEVQEQEVDQQAVPEQEAYQQEEQHEEYQPAGQEEYQQEAGQEEYQQEAGQEEYQQEAGQEEYQQEAGQEEYQQEAGQEEYQQADQEEYQAAGQEEYTQAEQEEYQQAQQEAYQQESYQQDSYQQEVYEQEEYQQGQSEEYQQAEQYQEYQEMEQGQQPAQQAYGQLQPEPAQEVYHDLEQQEPVLDEDAETEDVPSPNTVVCVGDIDDLADAPTKAIITEVVTIPAPLGLKLSLSSLKAPPAPTPEDVPETPASPTDDGEEPGLIFPPYLRGRYVYEQVTHGLPLRLAPRDPRQRIMPPPLPIPKVLTAEIQNISDDSSQEEEEDEEEESTSEDEEEEEEEQEEEEDDRLHLRQESHSTADSVDPMLQTIDVTENPDKIYYIRRDDGTVHAGQVLQSRATQNSASPNEYYVHYVGFNRRLDGWVPRHCISENAEDLGGFTLEPEEPEEPLDCDTPGTSSQMLAKQAAAAEAKAKAKEAAAAAAATAAASARPKKSGFRDYYLSATESNRYDYSDRKMTRYQKRRYDEINHVQKSHADLSATNAAEKEYESITKIKYIDKLQFGNYEIDTWYFSPYPGDYGQARTLYVCEYCLKYMRFRQSYAYHQYHCERRRPPGKEIYRKGNISIYEVIGKEEPLYCQLLCLMAKLFLDHKVLYFDMDPFYFYILCETDRQGSHVVGYFSKEKKSMDNYNVACILVMPPHQRKGFGKLLIAFSYVLSRKEGVIGSPETPLSDLGRLSYRSYWAYTLLELMKNRCSPEQTTIKELSDMSGITHEDIIYTLQSLKMIKYWKGQNVICVTAKTIRDHLQLPQFKQPKLTIDLDCLVWKPHNTAASRMAGIIG